MGNDSEAEEDPAALYREIAAMLNSAEERGEEIPHRIPEWVERTGPDDSLCMLPELRDDLLAVLSGSAPTFGWIELGERAYALADGEQIIGALYWQPAGPAEKERPGGEPAILDAAFFFVSADSVSDHRHVMDGPCASQQEWDVVLDHVATHVQYTAAADEAPEPLAGLMRRFAELDVAEGRALYATLSLKEQGALDRHGLTNMWRTMSAMETHGRAEVGDAGSVNTGEDGEGS